MDEQIKKLLKENRLLVATCNLQRKELMARDEALRGKDEIINSLQKEIEHLKENVAVKNEEFDIDDEWQPEDEPELDIYAIAEFEGELESDIIDTDTTEKETNPFSCYWDTLYSVLHKAIEQDAFIPPAKASKPQRFETIGLEQLTSYVTEVAGAEYMDEFLKLGALFGVLDHDLGVYKTGSRIIDGKRVKTVEIAENFVNYLLDNCR